jgi:tellurite resistance protein TehA-like permease
MKLPASEVIVSTFLPIGPLGMGGAGIMQLGIVAKDIQFISPDVASIFYATGVFIGLLFFGNGLLWLVFAVSSIAAKFPRIKFSMAWWGFTFPLGKSVPTVTDFEERTGYFAGPWETLYSKHFSRCLLR